MEDLIIAEVCFYANLFNSCANWDGKHLSLRSKVGIITSKSVLRVQGNRAIMPNRYEREIEEILRNLEQAEQTKPGLGQKFSERLRRRPSSVVRTRQRRSFSLRFTIVEWLLIIAVGAALLAGGYAFANNETANVFTGIVAAVGTVCLILIALSHFLFGSRNERTVRYASTPSPRGRGGPFSALKTQWNLFLLKLRYRRKNRL